MSLAECLAEEFLDKIRSRGDTYFGRGAVDITYADEELLEAQVKGSDVYDVSLELDGDRVAGWCTCPYFDRGEPCKHLWAAIRAADERQVLQSGSSDAWIDLCGVEELTEEDSSPSVADEQRTAGSKAAGGQKRKPDTKWDAILSSIRRSDADETSAFLTDRGHIEYLIDVQSTMKAQDCLYMRLQRRARKKDGKLGKARALRILGKEIPTLPDAVDRRILAVLKGADSDAYYGYGNEFEVASDRYGVPGVLLDELLPLLCRTQRCRLILRGDRISEPLLFDEGSPWSFKLDVKKKVNCYEATGYLVRGNEHRALSSPVLLLASGWVFWPDRLARLDVGSSFAWIAQLQGQGTLTVPLADGPRFSLELLTHPYSPKLSLPDELQLEQVTEQPIPKLVMHEPAPSDLSRSLPSELRFQYGSNEIGYRDEKGGWFDKDKGLVITRNNEVESPAAARLLELGCSSPSSREDGHIGVRMRDVSRIVRTLIDEGWIVEGEGRRYRKARDFNIEVTSNIDWFEVSGVCEFDGASVKIPELLNAIRRGEETVRLGDGSHGILPEEWLQKLGLLASLGKGSNKQCTFHRAQAAVLDVLLESAPAVHWDEEAQRLKAELRGFDSIKPEKEPSHFKGELRPYQREGLGWLCFLQRFGFGGCLADDMGLGKTVQVLALLAKHTAQKSRRTASLVVVPRSLIFNWMLEAKQFTPELRILEHVGLSRAKSLESFGDFDLILTTYGTLRRDILLLKEYEFDYVILDEAQAIKNSTTQAAKATRLLQARHRLALSGTPIENHLGELWSLFEFLNPGVLGASRTFEKAFTQAGGGDPHHHELLARVIRPFILRRKKDQVAKDLPAKFEETLCCELGRTERKRYNEIRDHYRASLLSKLDKDGVNKSKMHVLEALLRLRQAACHPGLIDKGKTDVGSAKLDTLLFQLDEILEEGHKVLVFSQFTSFLTIVRERLDAGSVNYEYLDGRTRKRADRVERFQNDPECKLFLISLKAGGLGLNLTAADYVFLLDPWWNPAVEAQAIDRAHRIGQRRKVFAYRIIAEDTVEEKVLELQKNKRELADAIIGGSNSLIRNITREDIDLLLS